MELAENSHAITTYLYNTIEQFFLSQMFVLRLIMFHSCDACSWYLWYTSSTKS